MFIYLSDLESRVHVLSFVITVIMLNVFCFPPQPDISKFASELLPLLFQYLGRATQEANQNPKGLTKCYYALEMFCENLGRSTLNSNKVDVYFCRYCQIHYIYPPLQYFISQDNSRCFGSDSGISGSWFC